MAICFERLNIFFFFVLVWSRCSRCFLIQCFFFSLFLQNKYPFFDLLFFVRKARLEIGCTRERTRILVFSEHLEMKKVQLCVCVLDKKCFVCKLLTAVANFMNCVVHFFIPIMAAVVRFLQRYNGYVYVDFVVVVVIWEWQCAWLGTRFSDSGELVNSTSNRMHSHLSWNINCEEEKSKQIIADHHLL